MKRILFSLIIAAFVCAPSLNVEARLRTATFLTSGSGVGLNSAGITIDSTGANFFLTCWGMYSGISADPTITDDNGNASNYVADTGYTTATPTKVRCAHVEDVTGGTVGAGHHIGLANPTVAIAAGFASFSGINAGTSVLSGQQGTTGASTSTLTVPALTCSENNCLYITAIMFEDNSGGTVSVNGGFTIMNTAAFNGATNEGFSWAYLVQGTAASVSPQWNVTNTTAALAATTIAFKGPGGGGGGPAAPKPLNMPIIIMDPKGK